MLTFSVTLCWRISILCCFCLNSLCHCVIFVFAWCFLLHSVDVLICCAVSGCVAVPSFCCVVILLHYDDDDVVLLFFFSMMMLCYSSSRLCRCIVNLVHYDDYVVLLILFTMMMLLCCYSVVSLRRSSYPGLHVSRMRRPAARKSRQSAVI